jgi:hypothetical protein
MAFDMFDVAEPGAIKALGSNVRPVYYISGTHADTILDIKRLYLLDKDIFEKLNNSILKASKKVSKGDKVYFVPGCYNSGYKMREAVTSNGGKITKDYDKANIIVFPKILGTGKLQQDGNADHQDPFTKTRMYCSASTGHFLESIKPEYNFLVHNSLKAPLNTSDDLFYLSSNNNYHLYRTMINNHEGNNLLPEEGYTPWRLSGIVSERHLAHTHILVAGGFINLVYTAAKNKATVIDERAFMENNLEASTVLNKDTVIMLTKMLQSREDDQKLATMLLCNSDYKEKEHYVYLISKAVGGYCLEQFKRLKEVKNFLIESKFLELSECRYVEYLNHLYANNKSDYLKDEYFRTVFVEKVSDEIKYNLPHHVQNAIKASNVEISWTIKLPELEGVA